MRIIADLKSLEEALKVEESIKTGYVDVILESLLNWIAVTEDLSESYEKISRSLPSQEEKETADKLYILSRSDAEALKREKQEFEGFDNEYQKRIRLLRSLDGPNPPPRGQASSGP